MYGMGAKLLSSILNTSIDECKQILDEFYKMFPGVKEFTKKNEADAKNKGYVEDYMGRRRHLPDAQLPDVTINAFKDVYTNADVFLDIAPQDTKIKVLDKDKTKQWENIYDESYKGKGFDSKVKFKELAKESGIDVLDNGAFISKTLTQCTNARIQGCLSGETFIQTKELGIKYIKDIVGKNVHVWDGKDWTTCNIIATGLKQKCVITFSNGQKFICSPNHLFKVVGTNSKTYWKRCDELKFNHKVAISESYIDSDFRYKSTKDNLKHPTNANLYYLDDIKDSFFRGQFLGRLASDGSYSIRDDGGTGFILLFAEHEYNILDKFKELPYNVKINSTLRENRNQEITTISCNSLSLIKEICDLDIKHKLAYKILEDTKMLRGFISGFYDGDGSAAGNHISLVFGTQYNFEPFIRDLQKALLMIGIRSRYRKYNGCYKLIIYKYDHQLFTNRISFINTKKQALANKALTVHNEHIFGKVLTVNNVEITNEFIEMYDICDTERGYYVADGLIVHNSASSLTKKAMVLINNDEKLNKLGFKLLIPVHDELLGECPAINAEIVSERLAELMISAAKPECSVDMKVDTYVTKHWYADEVMNSIQNDYLKKIKTTEVNQVIKDLCTEHSELSEDTIKQMCEGTFDLVNGELK